MPPAPERQWSLKATLRGTTYGTEAQARETAERWRNLVAVAAGSDVELVSVDVHDPELAALVAAKTKEIDELGILTDPEYRQPEEGPGG